MTKRLFLKKRATLFDLIGFAVPFIVAGRSLLQKMWLSGADWDDSLPDNLCIVVRRWFDQLEALQDIKVHCCLCLESLEESLVSTLHAFTDASEEAYGAVAYLCYQYQSAKPSCCRICGIQDRSGSHRCCEHSKAQFKGSTCWLSTYLVALWCTSAVNGGYSLLDRQH